MKMFIAYCDCGYKSDEMIDVGKLAYEIGPLLFPCLCEKCTEVVEVNLDNNEPQCPKCSNSRIIPYDDKSICIKGEFTDYFKVSNLLGRGVQITNGEYKCPKCNKMTLKFLSRIIGNLD